MKLRKKIITKNYNRVEPRHDFLKYLRVVRYWVAKNYDLTYPELEMLLFLYSETLFSDRDIKKFQRIMNWDANRFNKLIEDDWIVLWRENTKTEKALYNVSFKGKKLMAEVYKRLNMEKEITTDPRLNKVFSKDAGYMDRGYQKMIREMNEAVKRARME
jgi:hypothetical protein